MFPRKSIAIFLTVIYAFSLTLFCAGCSVDIGGFGVTPEQQKTMDLIKAAEKYDSWKNNNYGKSQSER